MKDKQYKNYKILDIVKLDKTGDYESFLWRMQNMKTDARFSYITTVSGTRIATKKLVNDEKIKEDAWPFVTFNLDQEVEKNEHKIELYSDSELGKYFTPAPVVDFIFDILNILKNKEDKETCRWQSHKPRPHYPSVIDPACGEGIFLKKAVESGFTSEDPSFKAPYVWGIDIDGEAVAQWEKISVLKLFHGDRAKMKNHFFHQNGLVPLEHKILTYKKGTDDLQQFDVVVGNPPYGGIGVDFGGKLTQENQRLLEALEKFEIFGLNKTQSAQIRVKSRQDKSKDIKVSLFDQVSIGESVKVEIKPNYKVGVKKVIEKSQSMPIEILFVERFLQLCKPGGWIAIIIPDGILANSTYDYVRRFIVERAKILAIVSLPRGTFKEAGTNAKTSILFLQKAKDKLLTPKDLDYPVFLVSTQTTQKEYFDIIVKEFKSFVETGKLIMDKNNKNPKIIRWSGGKEAIMIRGDKTLGNMLMEKPSSRWDVNYWHPKLDNGNLFPEVSWKIDVLKHYIVDVQGGGGGSHFSAYLGDKWGSQGKFATYIHVGDIMNTGINWTGVNYIDEQTYHRLETKQVKQNDLLISNKGTVGKSVVLPTDHEKTVIGDTRIVRLHGINPYYVCIYFKSRWGQLLNEKFKSGVASEGTTVEQLEAFKIPVFGKRVQKHVEQEYLKMSKFHNKAMEAKKRENEKEYKENLETAEKMLRDLTAKTEAVIRGEREDVV
ncbi:MAG: N-6 DNA methylase [Candidatus Cloacimonetes bacterium]|nr:N-6 DNA methylase [Candidatus Cloacimonadota bacterium]